MVFQGKWRYLQWWLRWKLHQLLESLTQKNRTIWEKEKGKGQVSHGRGPGQNDRSHDRSTNIQENVGLGTGVEDTSRSQERAKRNQIQEGQYFSHSCLTSPPCTLILARCKRMSMLPLQLRRRIVQEEGKEGGKADRGALAHTAAAIICMYWMCF